MSGGNIGGVAVPLDDEVSSQAVATRNRARELVEEMDRIWAQDSRSPVFVSPDWTIETAAEALRVYLRRGRNFFIPLHLTLVQGRLAICRIFPHS